MAFENDKEKLDAVVERARRGDNSLSDAEIVAAVDEFDAAMTGRLNGERAAELLLLAVAPLCFYRPSVGDEIMPIALWPMLQMGYDDAALGASALSKFAHYADENSLLEAPVLDWLRHTASDDATLEKWLGTVRVWIIQSQSDA